jgi:hypothetical protein
MNEFLSFEETHLQMSMRLWVSVIGKASVVAIGVSFRALGAAGTNRWTR